MVDLKKIQTLDQITPQPQIKVRKAITEEAGPSFKDALTSVDGGMKPAATPGMAPGMMNGLVNPAGLPKAALDGVKFSNHAIERMRTRGISYSPEDVSKISDAVSRAAAKGSKDSLILMNDSALIVSVKNNTVVTVMDKNALKENVFTNIDSTVVL